MGAINSYEEFCRAFQTEEDLRERAELLLLLQDWIIRVSGQIEQAAGDYHLDRLLAGRTDFERPDAPRKDALSRIVDRCGDSFRHISQHMRETILRENVKMPVHKVKEVNSYGMIWLSRQPGETIRQKISSANAMMAVRRRMSPDTGENRLFAAFLREAAERLERKLDSRSDPEEEDILGQFTAFLCSGALEEVRRWENLPPNNTLLSDQNYKKIWQSWNELKQLDDIVRQSDECLPERMCTLLYVELLRQLRRFDILPQLPVTADYEQYQVQVHAAEVFALDGAEKQLITLRTGGSALELDLPSGRIEVRFSAESIRSCSEREGEVEYPLSQRGLLSCLDDILYAGHGTGVSLSPQRDPTAVRCGDAAIDLFSLYPLYMGRDGSLSVLPGRMMVQDYRERTRDEETIYHLPCDQAQGVILSEDTRCETIHSAMEEAEGREEDSIRRLGRLIHLLETYLTAPRLTFLVPDLYTEFQLTRLRKAVRMAYRDVRSFPKSIGAAFYCQSQNSFRQFFQDNSFLLFLDLVGSELTMTLVQGRREERAGQLSLVWERHPTASVSLEEEMMGQAAELGSLVRTHRPAGRPGDGPEDWGEWREIFRLLGLEGLRQEAEEGRDQRPQPLTFFLPGDRHLTLSGGILPLLNGIRFDVSAHVERFLEQCRGILGDAQVYLYSFTTAFLCRVGLPLRYISGGSALAGYHAFQALQERTRVPLWSDHLPELSIKMLYGVFPLMRQVRVTPRFGSRERIPVDSRFTLPKNCASYQFDLIQRDMNQRSQFVAVVEHPAFPLSEDTECRLGLWYQYGEENPFTLLFRPEDPVRAGFSQAKVVWRPRDEVPYPYQGQTLPAPGFPASPRWSELEHHQGPYGEESIPQKLTEYFTLVREGYDYLDLSDYPVQMQGTPGERSFIWKGDLGRGPMAVRFFETNLEDVRHGPPLDFGAMGQISFQLMRMGDTRYEKRLYPQRNGRVWSPNKRNIMTHTAQMELGGRIVQLQLYANRFDEAFDETIDHVTFELSRPKVYEDGTESYMALHIRAASAGEPGPVFYTAKSIRSLCRPTYRVYDGQARFLMNLSFLAGARVSDPDCPPALREAFEQAREPWLDMYRRCTDRKVQNLLFSMMSLTADSLGDDYYELAQRRVGDYIQGKCWLPEHVGCALGSGALAREQTLLDRICAIPHERMVLGILARAVWGHPDFVKNIPQSLALKYVDSAIDLAGELFRQWRGATETGEKENIRKNVGRQRDMQSCFEYILGVFRLRKLGDEKLNWMLSLNNPKQRELYRCVEDVIRTMEIEGKVKLRTFLRLNIPDKKQYAEISDLAYAMLVYTTGQEEGDAIQISGISGDGSDGL